MLRLVRPVGDEGVEIDPDLIPAHLHSKFPELLSYLNDKYGDQELTPATFSQVTQDVARWLQRERSLTR